ncbi:hypothetical protein HRbin09_00930 [bacterium HR09]|nr:hypothetical protein HRbin09_00930 [bacterium HR09]
MGNDRRRRLEDGLRRAVVVAQGEHLGAGVGVLKAQDVLQLRAAEAVNALVLVAHGGEVGPGPGQVPEQLHLHGVGVLKLVHQEVGEALAQALSQARILGQELYRQHQHVVKVHRSCGLQALLVALHHRGHQLRGRNRRGRPVLPAGNGRPGRPGGKLSGGDPQLLEHLLHQAPLLVLIGNGKTRGKPHLFRVLAQKRQGKAVEGAHKPTPQGTVQQLFHPLGHFPGCFVGEGHGQNVVGLGSPRS